MPKAKANSSRKEGGRDKQSQIEVQDSNGAMPLLASKGAVDSRLAALFAGSVCVSADESYLLHLLGLC